MGPEELVARYRPKGLLLDTNLLVLLFVGLYRRDRIVTFKRTQRYTVEDFDLLHSLASLFTRRLTTPSILTETDNLARQLANSEHRALAAVVEPIIAKLFEVYIPSVETVRHRAYAHLGLTDTGIFAAAQAEDVLVVTDDLRLSATLSRLGRDVLNFNHIRSFDWT
jgi:hypothetical protein